MAKAPSRATAAETLSGWKEIADYLGRGVRTVQRYERDFGLPVKRAPTGTAILVIAVKAELDRWINSRPRRDEFATARAVPDLAGGQKAMTEKLIEMEKLQRQNTDIGKELSQSIAQFRRELRRSHKA